MHLNQQSGKVLTIFLVIIAVLLITLTGACIFFWNLEIEKRKEAERVLSTTGTKLIVLEEALASANKEKFLLEEKNKEADERVNNLLDELDLEKGLREEMKLESIEMKEKVDAAVKDKEKVETELGSIEKKINELEEKLKLEMSRNEELVKRNQQLEAVRKELESITGEVSVLSMDDEPLARSTSRDVELGEIVVSNERPGNMTGKMGQQGRVLSVDEETDFVVIDLGQKDGVDKGAELSVYRGDEYLGDIRVTRVQPEMAAADFIPPFTSRMARKNDQVIAK